VNVGEKIAFGDGAAISSMQRIYRVRGFAPCYVV
jgi:hypothetical protein